MLDLRLSGSVRQVEAGDERLTHCPERPLEAPVLARGEVEFGELTQDAKLGELMGVRLDPLDLSAEPSIELARHHQAASQIEGPGGLEGVGSLAVAVVEEFAQRRDAAMGVEEFGELGCTIDDTAPQRRDREAHAGHPEPFEQHRPVDLRVDLAAGGRESIGGEKQPLLVGQRQAGDGEQRVVLALGQRGAGQGKES